MILRRYANAAGEQQEIVLSKGDWEKVTDELLDEMLGFKKAAPAPEPAPVEAPALKKAPTKKGK